MDTALAQAERLVCAILAEQVAVLRDRMDATTAFDLLWRTTALLSWLSGLLGDMARHGTQANPILERERHEALAEISSITRSLDELAFFQAQRQDFVRQIADCMVTALTRMSAPGTGTHITPDELATLYVSADQRKLHQDVMKRSES